MKQALFHGKQGRCFFFFVAHLSTKQNPGRWILFLSSNSCSPSKRDRHPAIIVEMDPKL